MARIDDLNTATSIFDNEAGGSLSFRAAIDGSGEFELLREDLLPLGQYATIDEAENVVAFHNRTVTAAREKGLAIERDTVDGEFKLTVPGQPGRTFKSGMTVDTLVSFLGL